MKCSASFCHAIICIMTQVCLSGAVHAAPSEWACAEAARTAEQTQQVPQQFLEAMGRVESGQYVPGHTALVAWPWTVNAEGRGYFYNTKQDAIQAVRDMQQRGVESIDVGCLQINLRQHPDAFSSLEHAFDPVENTVWAAHFLKTLYARTGSWPHAAAAYHSFTPDIGAVYQQKVLEAWASPEGVKSGAKSSGRQMKNQPAIVADRGNSQPAINVSPHIWRGASYIPPPPRPVRSSGETGRTLASYRASPVRMAALRNGQRSGF